MDNQVTIFDVLPNENQPDFRKMTIEEIVKQVELMTGLVFFEVNIGFRKEYRANVDKNSGVEVGLGKYVYEERKNEPFIHCSCWKNNGYEGQSQGCDSIEQVVDMIRKYFGR